MPPPPRILPDDLLDLLRCPLCSPPALLRAPVTLHCGHTVCASHFASPDAPSSSKSPNPAASLPQCPLPTCSASSRTQPNQSHLPPVDVTANKLIELLSSASRQVNTPGTPPPSFHDDPDDRTDSEYEVDSDSDLEYLPLAPQSPTHTPGSTTSPTSSISQDPSRTRLPLPLPTPPSVPPGHRPRTRSDSSPQLHPRKRRRRLRPRPIPPTARSQAHRNDHEPHDKLEKELLSELTCEICFGLFWQPVTTPCQHTFCIRCLFRSLDHSPNCPLCRQTLPGYDYFQQHPCNKVILAILLQAFPRAYAERGAAVEGEERDARLDTPVFVCQLSFPGMPTILHFFEPRYRLMLRRCLESPNPCFGMIPPPRAAPSTSANGSMSTGNDYGTMLQIRNVQTFPDGRSLVETWGTWRFRVMERGMRDGYMVARIERIEDYEEELDPDAFPPPVSVSPPEDAQEPSSEPEGRRARLSDAGTSAGPSEAHTAESRAEADEPLEAALRAEIGDVLHPNPAQTQTEAAPAASRSVATPSASTRSGPGASAIPPASSPSGSPDDRSDARPQAAGTRPPQPTHGTHGDAARAGPPTANAKRAPTNAELIAKCHAFIEQTRQGTPWVVQHLHNNYVPMPADPASFSFWMALLLPIDEHEKAKLLPIRSPRLRLRLVVHWIEQLNSHWADAYASASALQVVLWRVRYFMMLPRAVGVWAMLFAYTALLAAVYFGQALSARAPGYGAPPGLDRPGGEEL